MNPTTILRKDLNIRNESSRKNGNLLRRGQKYRDESLKKRMLDSSVSH